MIKNILIALAFMLPSTARAEGLVRVGATNQQYVLRASSNSVAFPGGITTSTFTATSSVTASAFFGDASHLTGAAPLATAFATTPTKCSASQFPLGVDVNGNAVNCTAAGAGDVYQTTANTFSSSNTFVSGSTLAFNTGSFLVNLTSTVVANLDALSWNNGTTLTGVCVTGSTVTINGSDFDVRFAGGVCDNGGCNGTAGFLIGYLVDGAYPSGQSTTLGASGGNSTGSATAGANLSFIQQETTAFYKSHNFCLRLVNVNLSGISKCGGSGGSTCRFSVRRF